jgi:hypothetical protein
MRFDRFVLFFVLIFVCVWILVQISWIFVYEYRVSYEVLQGSFCWYMDLVPFVHDLLKFDQCYLCKIVKNFIVRTKNYNHDFCSNRLIRWMWNMNFQISL